jgi:GT2 family glycosyltransferase
MTVELSICIPSKDRHADVLRCLTSIAQQSVQPKEVLVMDQSSPAYELPPMGVLKHICKPELSGTAAAKNRCAQEACGENILILDDDVELLPGCLQSLIEALHNYPEAAAVSCNPGIESMKKLYWWNLHTMVFARGFFNGSPLGGNPPELRVLAGCAMALKRGLLLEEPFDENLVGYSYGEDWELSHRLLRHGKLLLATQAGVIHHVSPLNRYGIRQLQRDRWDNFLYFYEKLEASRYLLNRFWRLWWEVGESALWLKEGMGLPILGLQTRNSPIQSRSLRRL